MTNRLATLTAEKEARVGAHPSASNFCFCWACDIAHLGLTIVAVEPAKNLALWQFKPIATKIGTALDTARLGRLDSVSPRPTIAFFYIRTGKLVEALQQIRAGLEAIGFLAGCKIVHTDTAAGFWRTYYPEAPLQ